jgi:hypothetical protein
MSDVSLVVEIILRIARNVQSTGSTKENIPTSPFETIHSSCINKKSYAATNIKQDQHINQPLQQTSDIQGLKNMMKSL